VRDAAAFGDWEAELFGESGGAIAENVFWSRPAFGPLVVFADRIGRVAVVDVFAWKEAA